MSGPQAYNNNAESLFPVGWSPLEARMVVFLTSKSVCVRRGMGHWHFGVCVAIN